MLFDFLEYRQDRSLRDVHTSGVGHERWEADLEHDEASQEILFYRICLFVVNDRPVYSSLQAFGNVCCIVVAEIGMTYRNAVEPSNVKLTVVLDFVVIEVELDALSSCRVCRVNGQLRQGFGNQLWVACGTRDDELGYEGNQWSSQRLLMRC